MTAVVASQSNGSISGREVRLTVVNAMAPKVVCGKTKRKGGKTKKKVQKTKAEHNQGLQGIDVTDESFDVKAFAQQMMASIGVAVNQDARVCKVATACSGSGAPTMVLGQMVANLREEFACEIDEAAAHALAINANPCHIHKDVFHQASQKKCFCYVCGKACRAPDSNHGIDVYMCGWPCNSNSMLNNRRFKEDATTTPHAAVLPAVADSIARVKPKAFILENVAAIKKKRHSEDDRSVAEWVKEVLGEKLPEYQTHDFMLTSHPVSGPHRCHGGAETVIVAAIASL